jgi:hypothetical protein
MGVILRTVAGVALASMCAVTLADHIALRVCPPVPVERVDWVRVNDLSQQNADLASALAAERVRSAGLARRLAVAESRLYEWQTFGVMLPRQRVAEVGAGDLIPPTELPLP